MAVPISSSTPQPSGSETSSSESAESFEKTLSFDISEISTCEEAASPYPLEVANDPISICSLSVDQPIISVEPEVMNVCGQPQSTNAGFKIVFDNIDKTIKPRHMTIDRQSQSLHYVQAYAVKDRIDYSTASEWREDKGEYNLYSLLPDSEDYVILKKRFAIHVSRIMTTYLTFFHEDFHYLPEKHIKHKYSTEMCKKSEVVRKNFKVW